MKSADQRDFRVLLRAITNPGLLSKVPLLVILLLTTLVHLVTSIDLGFRDLGVRAPIALVSVIPAFFIVWLAHRISSGHEVIRLLLVPLAYFAGGALRGSLLEHLLQEAGVLQGEFQTFRIYAGTVIVASTFILVSYTLSTVQQAARDISQLQTQTKSLAEALVKVREDSVEEDHEQFRMIQERISTELFKTVQVGPSNMRDSLERLVFDVIRPLSQDFARDVRNWQPPSTSNLQLTPRVFWSYIDPVKHLRTPVVGIASMIVASLASLLSLFDLRDALEVIIGASLTLLISSFAVFRAIGRFFKNLKSPIRELLLTFSFVFLALPTVWVQRWALAGNENPDLYVVPTLVITPIFGWVILIASAALGLSKDLTGQLRDIRNELKWTIARINLLTWYRSGLISRILHGPVQNSIQVAILRMRSADENQSMEIANEVISRIDGSLKELLDPKTSPERELQELESIHETWKRVADISIEISDRCKAALREDLAATSIVTDLIQEVCSNAIRHGDAKKIAIEAELGEGSIAISVIDDGTPGRNPDGGSGLGTQFLQACSIEWQQRSSAGRNELELHVPIGRISQLTH